MEDKELGQMIIEYGFLNDEQLEEALKRQKESSENKTLAQMLIQEGALSVRALKMLHSAAQRRKDTEKKQGDLKRKFEKSKQRTKGLIRMDKPEAELPLIRKQSSIGFGIKQDSQEEKLKFRPLTLVSLKEDVEELQKLVSELREEVEELKSALD